jgi:hypothetical protein
MHAKRKEEERAMDAYSAELQERTRKEAYDRAAALLMKDSDIARRLRSGMMISDVLKVLLLQTTVIALFLQFK